MRISHIKKRINHYEGVTLKARRVKRTTFILVINVYNLDTGEFYRDHVWVKFKKKQPPLGIRIIFKAQDSEYKSKKNGKTKRGLQNGIVLYEFEDKDES